MISTGLKFVALPAVLALASCTTAPVKTYHALADNGDKPSVEIQLDLQGENVTAVRMDLIGRDADGGTRHLAGRVSNLTQEHDPPTLHFQVNFRRAGAAMETCTLTTTKSFADTRDGTTWTLKSGDGEPVDFTPAGVKPAPATLPTITLSAATGAELARLERAGFAPAEDSRWTVEDRIALAMAWQQFASQPGASPDPRRMFFQFKLQRANPQIVTMAWVTVENDGSPRPPAAGGNIFIISISADYREIKILAGGVAK
jgi:hypothetical protein